MWTGLVVHILCTFWGQRNPKDVNCELLQSCAHTKKAFLGAKTFKDVNCEHRRKLPHCVLQISATHTGVEVAAWILQEFRRRAQRVRQGGLVGWVYREGLGGLREGQWGVILQKVWTTLWACSSPRWEGLRILPRKLNSPTKGCKPNKDEDDSGGSR